MAHANVEGSPCGDDLSLQWIPGWPYVGYIHPHPSPDSISQAADVESGAAPRNIGFPTSRGRQDENTSPWNYQQLATNVATSDLTNASRPPPRQTRDVMKAEAENFHGGGNITFFVRPEYRRSAVVISDEPKAKPCWNPPHMQHRWPCYKIEKKLVRRWWVLCCNVVHNHYLPSPPLDLINILLVKTSEWNNGEMEDGIDLRT